MTLRRQTALATFLAGCVSDFDPGPAGRATETDVETVPDVSSDVGSRPTDPTDAAPPQRDATGPLEDAGVQCRIAPADRANTPVALRLAGWSDAETGDTALIEFRLTTPEGTPVADAPVVFRVTGDDASGASLDPPSTRTDAAGRVVTRLRSSRRATLQVEARAACDWAGAGARSREYRVRGGPPSQRGLALECVPPIVDALASREPVSPAGVWSFAEGATVMCRAMLLDTWAEPVGPGVPVRFLSEAGWVLETVPTDRDGVATSILELVGPGPREVSATPTERAWVADRDAHLDAAERARRAELTPRDALIRVIAVTAGNEGFDDVDGDGDFTPGLDAFTPGDEPGEPFVDTDDSGTWTAGEPLIDGNGDELWTAGDGYAQRRDDLWISTTVLVTGPPDAALTRVRLVQCGEGESNCRVCDESAGCTPADEVGCGPNALVALRPGGAAELEVVLTDVHGNCPIAPGAAISLTLPEGPTWASEPAAIHGDALRAVCHGGTEEHPTAVPVRFTLRDTRPPAADAAPRPVALEAVLRGQTTNGDPVLLSLPVAYCALPAPAAAVPDARPLDAATPIDALLIDAMSLDAVAPDAVAADAAVPDAAIPDAGARPDQALPTDARLVDLAVADAQAVDVALPVDAMPAVDAATPLDAGVWAFPHHTTPFGTELIGLPAGTFRMGLEQAGAGLIAHDVTLTRPFWLGRTEVTVAEWHAAWLLDPVEVSLERPAQNPACEDCPVDGISWQDAARFANVVSAAEDLPTCYTADGLAIRPAYAADPYSCPGYRLPTSAEWEYAARAGTGDAYLYPGSNDAETLGWLMSNSGDVTHPVARLLPNGWGLYDLCGNVGEFTSEWNGPVPTFYSPEPAVDPWGPPTGEPNGWVVYRGDHYRRGPAPMYLPTGSLLPNFRGSNWIGLRLARTIQPGP
jgi:formylglycine-generating enzyme required for sulfatase activity